MIGVMCVADRRRPSRSVVVALLAEVVLLLVVVGRSVQCSGEFTASPSARAFLSPSARSGASLSLMLCCPLASLENEPPLKPSRGASLGAARSVFFGLGAERLRKG